MTAMKIDRINDLCDPSTGFSSYETKALYF